MKKTKIKLWTGSIWEEVFPETDARLVHLDHKSGDNLDSWATRVDLDLTELFDKNNAQDDTIQEVKDLAEEANDLALGSAASKVFDNYASLCSDLQNNPAYTSSPLKVGTHLLVIQLNVPDLWVSHVLPDELAEVYEYTDDATFLEALNTDGFIHIGKYWVSALETQKVNLPDYVKFTDYARYNKAGVVKTAWHKGVCALSDGLLELIPATDTELKNREQYMPVTGGNLDKAVKVGITTNTETWTDEEKAAACETIGAAKETDVELLTKTVFQSGLAYQADETEAWSERTTANGLNVLDGSKAILKKVVGSTVACKNLIPYPYLETTKTENGVTFTDNGDGTITINGTATATANFWFTRNKTDIILRQGEKITISAEGSTATAFIYLDMFKADGTIFSVAGTDGGIISKKDIPIDAVGAYIKIEVLSGNTFNNVTIKPMIEYGTTATEYQPYFTGLKSASFGGIESTNADGTETSTLTFPKTATPLGTTIDFENKKVVEEYAQYTFKGTENVGFYGAYGDGYYIYTITEGLNLGMKTGTAQYGVCNKYPIDDTAWGKPNGECVRLGQSGSNIYIILSSELTVAEVQSLIAGMTIRYPIATPIETDFTAQQSASGNEYTAYKDGTEKVLGNDGNEYGADNTQTVNYIFVKEA